MCTGADISHETLEKMARVFAAYHELTAVTLYGSRVTGNVIRQAYAAKLIPDAEAWTDMLVDRNLMSHTYDFARFEAVIQNVRSRYLSVLDDLYLRSGSRK